MTTENIDAKLALKHHLETVAAKAEKNWGFAVRLGIAASGLLLVLSWPSVGFFWALWAACTLMALTLLMASPWTHVMLALTEANRYCTASAFGRAHTDCSRSDWSRPGHHSHSSYLTSRGLLK